MNYTETIQAQIALLADLNRDLASQVTPEAAREIRKNVKLIVELAALKNDDVVADLEERLEALEEALFGDEDPAEAMEGIDLGYSKCLAQFIQDCREDINTIYDDWGPALDRHLGADWCEEVRDEEAGD